MINTFWFTKFPNTKQNLSGLQTKYSASLLKTKKSLSRNINFSEFLEESNFEKLFSENFNIIDQKERLFFGKLPFEFRKTNINVFIVVDQKIDLVECEIFIKNDDILSLEAKDQIKGEIEINLLSPLFKCL